MQTFNASVAISSRRSQSSGFRLARHRRRPGNLLNSKQAAKSKITTMKNLRRLVFAVAFLVLAACSKQQTEAERQAEVNREVEQRVAAEHQTQQQQELDQREADLKAREQTLALQQQQNAEATATPVPAETLAGETTVATTEESTE